MQTGKCVYYSDGVMQRVYATRVAQGKCPAGWSGPMASMPEDHVGAIVRASIQNPHTGLWSAPVAFLVVDCSQTVDLPRHLAEGLVFEVDYQTAQGGGFVDEGSTKARVEMSTGAVAAPDYIDATGLIQHVRTDTERSRLLSEITHQVAHYKAGEAVSASMTQAQEIAYMQALARYHQTQHDFGGGAHGRTLEYTNVVFPSGRIYRANRETLITWSHRDGNRVGMATLFVLGSGQEPTAAMLATGKQHFDYTASRGDTRVIKQRTWGHGETNLMYGGGPLWGNNTDCPGKLLPWVRDYRKGAGMPEPTPGQGANTQFFAETGHNLSNAFRDYWIANGGLARFGFPITEEQAGESFPFSALPELAGYTVQAFERRVFRYKAGEGVSEDVRVGALALALAGDGGHECACG